MNYQELLHSPIIPFQIATVAQKAAHLDIPVLIQGEKGTGKELIAKIIHYAGDWKNDRFFMIDCQLLTEDGFNEQLFRLFKEIHDGTIPATLYLKEVGALRPINQQRLLDLIEDGVFQKDGEKKNLKQLRFISSSSENLKEKVSQRKFSEELYYRLNTLSISIPALRERREEIPAMAQYLLIEHSKKMKMKTVGISPPVLMLLQNYWWPENLRELEQMVIRSAIFTEGETLNEKDLFFETENERSSFFSFLKKAQLKKFSCSQGSFSDVRSDHSLSLFLIELVHRVKNPLVSIKTFTQLLREKFNDVEFREYFYKIVTEDIERIDSVLNSLLNYIKINTPLQKTGTIHFILEEALKKNETQLEEKKIKVFKILARDLPETTVHEEHLRYIFQSLLQFALPSIPPDGSIEFLTTSLMNRKENLGNKTFPQEEGRSIEIRMVFNGYKKQAEQFENVLGIPAFEQEETIELELRLIKEMIQKNEGTMKIEVDEKEPRTLISMRFPIERRKLIYYRSTNVG